MKQISLSLILVLLCCFSYAQNAVERNIEYNKQSLSGYSIMFPNEDADMVEEAFQNKMETEYAMKASRNKGFKVYQNYAFMPFGNAHYDIYARVSESSKRSNKKAILELIVCSGNMNSISSKTDPETAGKIKAFLDEFASYVAEYSVRMEVNAMNAEMKKLNDAKVSLQKEQSKLQKQLDENKQNLDKTETDIQNLQSKLDALQSGK